MSKTFFEVFPALALQEDMQKLLSGIEVTKVSANRQKTAVRISICGRHLIPKPDIFRLEKEIVKQLFPNQRVEVKIIEKFMLSEQYCAESLMDIYGESIAQELNAYSRLLYSVYRNAQISFVGKNRMKLTLEDTMLAKERADELVHILEKIFCERCGVDFIADVSFAPKKEERRKQSDYMIEQEIRQTVRMAAMGRQKEEPEA